MTSAQNAIFKALSDPTRRAIFEGLCRGGSQSVVSLTQAAGISQPAVSKHLGILKNAGLVSDQPQGRQTFYSPNVGALSQLTDWTTEMTAFWNARFDALDDLLKRMDQ